MCGICGCSDHGNEKLKNHNSNVVHSHTHDENIIMVEENIFAENNKFAKLNNKYFTQNEILALNLMSSPGSGKTTLLSQTFKDLKDKIKMSIIVGDQQSEEDAKQLQKSGVTAVQVNTGKVCHLDAHMVGHALDKLPKQKQSILFIENIGNLVCPAFFNLGEHYKIVILSVTEGDNKPIKYPEMFRLADLVLITKMDLLPYVEFNLELCIKHIHDITPNVDILPISAKNRQGLDAWYEWLTIKTS